MTSRGSPTCMFVPQRGQLLQFSLSQSLLKDSSTAFWITLFPKRCSINFFPSVVADRYSSLRFRNSSATQSKLSLTTWEQSLLIITWVCKGFNITVVKLDWLKTFGPVMYCSLRAATLFGTKKWDQHSRRKEKNNIVTCRYFTAGQSVIA